ncbi:MAG: cadmium-translocating P-type ATPase [Oscillospiraceae bacterium]|jgi:Cd2+/Zn2+-exporting ATPase/Cu+-exporting ATPase|nr:cadmium-translocating P-type ATPase [Oscillospiraceae bacterium]
MKKINDLVGDSVKERSREYISEIDKIRFRREILTSMGALICLAAGLIYQKISPAQDVVSGLIFLLGVIIIGAPVLTTAIKGLFSADAGAAMEILVSIAMIVAVLDGQYVVAILIPIILTLVHFLEEKSIMGGRDAIEGLKKMQADTAILLEDGREREVDAKTLREGDLILVKPGMALPIDGTVTRGLSSMDQKSLTGESLPKEVKAGDRVFAGTTNIEGLLAVRVDKEYRDTSFQRIVSLLENAENITLPEARIVDRFMLYYIPVALIVATLVWLLTQDITRAIAVLVVSCPCGHMLVSSAPMIAALAAATKRGILIKNSAFVEKLADANYMVFDKTGTITNGTLEAVGYHLAKAEIYEALLAAAASVAQSSLHPTSKSIMLLCEDIDYDKTYEITETAGRGVKGSNGKDTVIVGNRKYLDSLGFSVTDAFEADGANTWVAKNGEVLGCIVFRDIPRADAPQAIEQLKRLGITQTCLLTGDNALAARRIVEAVSIDAMHSDLLPEQKLQKVKQARENNVVVVVGDGINDALALAEADVGIAMGAMGSDTAIQSADISLMNNSLENIPFVVDLAQKTKGTIYMNIIIAFAVSFVMICLAAGGAISAVLGAFLHNAGAFIILLNSSRILRNNTSRKPKTEKSMDYIAD